MFMVMIGVLLALLVDEWREERQIEEMVSLTEERVLSEIRENAIQLQSYSERLTERFEELQSWEQELGPELSFREQPGFPGMPAVSLSDAAWQRANSSDVTNYMNNELIEHAYGLYLTNERIINAEDRLLDPIFSSMG